MIKEGSRNLCILILQTSFPYFLQEPEKNQEELKSLGNVTIRLVSPIKGVLIIFIYFQNLAKYFNFHSFIMFSLD